MLWYRHRPRGWPDKTVFLLDGVLLHEKETISIGVQVQGLFAQNGRWIPAQRQARLRAPPWDIITKSSGALKGHGSPFKLTEKEYILRSTDSHALTGHSVSSYRYPRAVLEDVLALG